MRKYLVQWKGRLRRKSSWEREDALDKFMNLIRQFGSDVSTRWSMTWVGGECHVLLLLDMPSYWKDPSMGTNEPLKALSKERKRI